MALEYLPYHLSSLASIVADLVVAILAFRMWATHRSRGFLLLGGACALYFVESLYNYAVDLCTYGFFPWTHGDGITYYVYFANSFIYIAAQILFVISISLIIYEYRSRTASGKAC